jgi:hypothetical protein
VSRIGNKKKSTRTYLTGLTTEMIAQFFNRTAEIVFVIDQLNVLEPEKEKDDCYRESLRGTKPY